MSRFDLRKVVGAAIGCLALPLSASAEVPGSERAALDALYLATGGASWEESEGWFIDEASVCTDYFGVTCMVIGEQDHVTGLDLSGNNLDGVIPPEFGDLPYLQDLDLSSNQLSGPIPAEVANLGNNPSQVTPDTFDISYNKLFLGDSAGPSLATFLNMVQPDWQETQTVAPANVMVAKIDDFSATVSWDPILYSADPGSFEVRTSVTSGGPYMTAFTPTEAPAFTESKSELSIDVLLSGTGNDFFVVRTITDAIPAPLVPSPVPAELISDDSLEANGRCLAPLQPVQASGLSGILLAAASPTDNGYWNFCYDPINNCYLSIGDDDLDNTLAFTTSLGGGGELLSATSLSGLTFCGPDQVESTSDFELEFFPRDNPFDGADPPEGVSNCAREKRFDTTRTEGCFIDVDPPAAGGENEFVMFFGDASVYDDDSVPLPPGVAVVMDLPFVVDGDGNCRLEVPGIGLAFGGERELIELSIPMTRDCELVVTPGDETVAIITEHGLNQAPIADAGGPYSASAGETITFSGGGSIDPDGIIESYSWGFGDGAAGSGVEPMYDYADPGTYLVSLTVTDNAGLSHTMTTEAEIGAAPEPGDLDGDGNVDADDAALFFASFRRCAGDPGFNSSADYDGDGCVTFADYRIWYGFFTS